MEGTKITGWQKTLRSARRLYHSLNNYGTKAKNADFREFGSLEYAKVLPEEVNDLKRLNYIKKLDLAQKGYINKDLKALLGYFREKERLMQQDHKVLPIGSLKVLENENLLGLVQLGFESVNQTFFMASRNHGNIPLWKPFDGAGLEHYLSALHPVCENTLRFKHTFFETDVSEYTKENRIVIDKFYNETVLKSFRGNPYFKTSVLSPTEDLLSDPKKMMGKPFRLELSKNEHSIMTLTEATDRYFVFQSFLRTAPKPESIYFNKQEFKERFLDSGIVLMARLKHGLQLGVQNGTLQIGKLNVENGKSQLRWASYETRMHSNTLSAIEKYYLSKEIITKKNFLIEKDAIVLRSDTKQAHLKKHYASGRWHFAEVGKNQEALNFRPIDDSVLKHIQNNYGQSRNLSSVIAQMKINTNEQTLKL